MKVLERLFVNGRLFEVECPIAGTWKVRDGDGLEADVYLYRTGLFCRVCQARRCVHTQVVRQWLSK